MNREEALLPEGRSPEGRPRDRWPVPSAPTTPTRNAVLPFRRGGFSSLCEALDYAARGETGINFFDARGKLLATLPYSQLRPQSKRFARQLLSIGIGRGERLIIVADTSPAFCISFFGAQYAGVVPVPVAVPIGLGAKDSYIEQLKHQIRASGATAVFTPDELVDFVRTAAIGTSARVIVSLSTLDALREVTGPLQPLGRSERAYIQYSSGSTRVPLGVDIWQDQLMANIDGSMARQDIGADDSGVSWLPLYHDMGLIGFVLAPICSQRSVDLLAPSDFARRPMQWLSLISRRRATITYSPSSGYDLLTRRMQNLKPNDIDLSCLKLAGIGADMIRPDVLRRFSEAFASLGFDPRAFMPSYGMAELGVGLSFASRSTGFRTDRMGGREFVACGHILAEHHVQIRNKSGQLLKDRRIGRIYVRGPSVMRGYYLKAEETQEVLRDGWLDTGDLGYWSSGELVITGRAKDLIIIHGRNIWPQDIEWAAEAVPPLRRGDACAFAVEVEQTQEIILLVQGVATALTENDALSGQLRQVTRETTGIDCRIVFVPRKPGLPLTSSGKLKRVQARADYLARRAASQPTQP